MATRYWQGQADAVAQVTQVQVTTYDAATTYQVLVGGEVIGEALAAGTAAATATELASDWNLSTNPYATQVTASTSTDTLILTSDVPGLPFTITVSVTGGTGAFGTITTTTANAGPNDWATAANWSGDTVPVTNDTVIFRDGAVDVRWSLDQSAVDLTDLIIEQTYTGKIGLDRTAVVVAADGTTDATKPEYREDYLIIGWTDCRIGEILGPGAPAGSSRLKLDNDIATANTTEIFNSSSSSFDADLPAIRLLTGSAISTVYIRSAPGGFGMAIDEPGETATVGSVNISDLTPATRVFIGEGTTITTYVQQGGVNSLRAAANVTTARAIGGVLTADGDGYAITNIHIEAGATLFLNNVPTSGQAFSTCNINGGTLDGTQSRIVRAWGTINMTESGATIRADDNVTSIAAINEPDGLYTLSVG